jgi:signal transduction histidine kinase
MQEKKVEKTITVLLVEDNSGDIHLLRRMLLGHESSQFELTCVEKLAEALEKKDQPPFDVILLDLSLPDSMGLESFLAIQTSFPSVPVVVLTGLTDETLAIQAVRQGAQDYLVKGQVDKNLLVRAIRYAIERKQAGEKLLGYQKRLRSLTSKITLTQEQERRRIAIDLHDHIGQPLALAKIKLGFLPEMPGEANLREPVQEIRSLLDQAIQYTRSLTFDLSSPVLYEMGFEAAVEAFVDQFGSQHRLCTEFHHDDAVTPLSDEVRNVLFRAVQELLVNIVKHAHADKVTVSIQKVDDDICITVTDNGVGFDPALIHPIPNKSGGFGLFNIHERLDLLNGRLHVDSGPGKGTRIILRAPLKKNNIKTNGKKHEN